MKKTLIKNLSVILVLLVFVTFQVSATYPPVVYLNDLPSIASYVLKTDGTNYWNVRYDGYTSASSTNASYMIENTLYQTCLSGGGTVLLQGGDYYPQHPIFIYNNTALVGESRDSVIIHNDRPYTAWGVDGEDRSGLIRNQHYVNDTDALGFNQARDQNITIAHLTIDGNRTSSSGFGIAMGCVDNVFIDDVLLWNVASDSINFNGLNENQDGWGQGIGNATNIHITRTEIRGSGVDGIALNNVQHFFISDYYCNGFGKLGSGTNNGHAITCAGYTKYGEIENVIAYDSTIIDATDAFGSAAFVCFGGSSISYSNCWAINIDGCGFHFEENGVYNPNNIQLSNCHVENATRDSFSFKNCYYPMISNCWALNSGYGNATSTEDGFRLYNTENGVFSNLVIKDNQGTHSTEYAIHEDATCASNVYSMIQIYGYRVGNYTFVATSTYDNIIAVS